VAVFSGMLGVTAFGLFFTPVFYATVRWVVDRASRRRGPTRLPAVDMDKAAPTHEAPAVASAG